jgi:hypothetical protein
MPWRSALEQNLGRQVSGVTTPRGKVIGILVPSADRGSSLSPWSSPRESLYLLIGQLPGALQGAGVGRVVAVTSAEAAPSTPFTTTETCQR